MADETPNQNVIHGNVGKLTTIGTVNGNVLIINENATRDALNRVVGLSAPALSQYLISDIANYIKVNVKSKRFGRKVQLQVPNTMTVGAFTNVVVDVLQLPSSKSVDEFMISLDFQYTAIFGENTLSPTKNLQEVGIQDGSEIELYIATKWLDKIKDKRSQGPSIEYFGPKPGRDNHAELSELMGLANTFLASSGGREVSSEIRRALDARGIISQEKIESWTNRYFKYVDEIGT